MTRQTFQRLFIVLCALSFLFSAYFLRGYIVHGSIRFMFPSVKVWHKTANTDLPSIHIRLPKKEDSSEPPQVGVKIQNGTALLQIAINSFGNETSQRGDNVSKTSANSTLKSTPLSQTTVEKLPASSNSVENITQKQSTSSSSSLSTSPSSALSISPPSSISSLATNTTHNSSLSATSITSLKTVSITRTLSSVLTSSSSSLPPPPPLPRPLSTPPPTPTPITTTTTTITKPTTQSSINNKTKKIICVHFTGRLGNELFEYATTLGLALALNRTAVFLGGTSLSTSLKNFQTPSPGMEERCKKAKFVGEESCCKFNPKMTQLDPKDDYRVGIYLQSYRYFDSYTTTIRQAIVFNDKISTQSNKIVQKLRQKYNSSTLVGIHIRRGDMASERNQKLGYPLASPEYINKSSQYFIQLYSSCVFVMASDSLEWVKKNVPSSYTMHYLEGNEPPVDMMVLSTMDHVITTFGTFSWWVGYLNRGKTLYMKDFIKANTRIGNSFNPKGRDYIYPGWIPL